jgi:NAD(P)H-hydrate epimerase
MNVSQVRIVAVDVPSGLDADSGAGGATAVRAAATVTLVAPKPGLYGSINAGRVFVADIGMPTELFATESDGLARLYAIGDLVELADPEMSSNAERPR